MAAFGLPLDRAEGELGIMDEIITISCHFIGTV